MLKLCEVRACVCDPSTYGRREEANTVFGKSALYTYKTMPLWQRKLCDEVFFFRR